MEEKKKIASQERMVYYNRNSRSTRVTSLVDIGLKLIEGYADKEVLYISSLNIIHLLPLIFSCFPSIRKLSISPHLTEILSLSSLSLARWYISTHFNRYFLLYSPISLPSLQMLSNLHSLNIRTKPLRSLSGLTKNNTTSLKNLLIESPDLVDISSLKDCDLSSLEELMFNGCSSLSDISCLEGCSFPSLKNF